jgi:[FeFe] hydrogenase H-cluster maturation GTPase HydF
MNKTPNANRLHIALFGKRNSGKSSLINAITGQQTALVSDTPGTTADPVLKAMEVYPLGPCVFIDTAGFDDVGELGRLRVEATKNVIKKTDLAIIVVSSQEMDEETEWLQTLQAEKIPVLAVINKGDTLETEPIVQQIQTKWRLTPVVASAKTGMGIGEIKAGLARLVPEGFEPKSITGHLVSPDDVVLLVMPQDLQAPKGRLILPQVQTIRDLLDHKCVVLSVTVDQLKQGLSALKKPPKLIITDSQVFSEVYKLKPKSSILTSFSVLFAGYKGDITEYKKGADKIDDLTEEDTVLIAEACTHSPLDGDIGREKIPNMLRAKVGPGLTIQVVSGTDFPKDLSPYSLVIHCGGCMFNRRYVLSRIEQAKEQKVPITNYGIAIAKLKGILEDISL